MKTEYVFLTEETAENSGEIRRAGEIIKSGGLVAFPTETVYGLGGDALNPASSAKIYAAKGRPSDNPLIVHIADLKDAEFIAEDIPDAFFKLADALWPGPLTMIVKKSGAVPYETTGGLDTVAIRFPSNRIAQALIRAGGGFIAAPSANRSGRPSPTMAQYCREDLDGLVEMIIDGGQVGIGVESTIVDLTEGEPTLLRPGYVTPGMLKEILGGLSVDPTIYGNETSARPKAPGMRYRHYAPSGELTIVEGSTENVVSYINEAVLEAKKAGKKTGVICAEETAPLYGADRVFITGKRGDEEAAARELFRILRMSDDEHLEVIYAEAFGSEGLGLALMNRMIKAAGHRIVRV